MQSLPNNIAKYSYQSKQNEADIEQTQPEQNKCSKITRVKHVLPMLGYPSIVYMYCAITFPKVMKNRFSIAQNDMLQLVRSTYSYCPLQSTTSLIYQYIQRFIGSFYAITLVSYNVCQDAGYVKQPINIFGYLFFIVNSFGLVIINFSSRN